jgi:cell division protein FtsW
VKFQQLTPFFDQTVAEWPLEARLVRWATLLWLGIGLVILWSATYSSAVVDKGNGLFFVYRQLMWIAVGLVGFQFFAHSSLKKLTRLSSGFFFGLLGLLLFTLLLPESSAAGGATRWIHIGPVQIQPSELIKPFLILQSAALFGQWNRFRWSKRFFWLSIFVVMLLAILKQPNLSTTALCGMSLWLIALSAGIPYLYLSLTAGGGVCMGILSIMHNDYQRDRVAMFLNPFVDPLNKGYQLVQSLLAVGSGSTTGTGFGLSMQKLTYLPVRESDFIFSVFAEEFGFLGCLGLMLMLGAYSFLALRIAQNTKHPIYRLIAIGSMVFLIGQALLNIGVNIGALPTTGLPFPLISYGGSSMIASLLIAGLLIRVARENAQSEIVEFKAVERSPKISA